MISYPESWALALEDAVDAAAEAAMENGEDQYGFMYDGCITCLRRLEWTMVMEAALIGARDGLVELVDVP